MNYDNFNLVENRTEINEEPEERVNVEIEKDQRSKDFGFSISDNFFGPGILINKIRNGSPADENPHLQPFTQIYQVSLTTYFLYNQ